MKYFAEGLKNLPINLKYLRLYLYSNNLGDYKNNIKYLAEGLKHLPDNL